MVTNKRTKTNAGEDLGKGQLIAVKAVWSFLKNLELELLYDPARSRKPVCLKDACIPVFTAALFITVRVWNQPRCSTGR